MQGVTYENVSPPACVKAALMQLVRSYHLRFAAIDMIVDKQGAWIFLEINPNGQWAWLDLAGGSQIWRSFATAFSAKLVQ